MPGGELAMAGPSTRPDGRTIPVRGDLAHIRLAGVHFVPHYAVPMPHVAGPQGAQVRLAGSADAEVLGTLKAGEAFDVLDIAGDWAWGEVPGGKGPVGYVALADLKANAS
ncbi:MAG: SH3 domain-containing protein [Novosphingobium sp.]|nr:SH3 domain-containing protein [Novosphingobium sp.]